MGLPAGRGDGRSWLLIKHSDDWAGDVDITEFAPRSVKSDGDFADILAADKPDMWTVEPAGEGRRGGRDARIDHRAGCGAESGPRACQNRASVRCVRQQPKQAGLDGSIRRRSRSRQAKKPPRRRPHRPSGADAASPHPEKPRRTPRSSARNLAT